MIATIIQRKFFFYFRRSGSCWFMGNDCAQVELLINVSLQFVVFHVVIYDTKTAINLLKHENSSTCFNISYSFSPYSHSHISKVSYYMFLLLHYLDFFMFWKRIKRVVNRNDHKSQLLQALKRGKTTLKRPFVQCYNLTKKKR